MFQTMFAGASNMRVFSVKCVYSQYRTNEYRTILKIIFAINSKYIYKIALYKYAGKQQADKI